MYSITVYKLYGRFNLDYSYLTLRSLVSTQAPGARLVHVHMNPIPLLNVINYFFFLLDVKENMYIFVFDETTKNGEYLPTFSITNRKVIMCEDHEISVGATLRVKDGLKAFEGKLLNIRPKEQLELLITIQERNAKSPRDNKRKSKQHASSSSKASKVLHDQEVSSDSEEDTTIDDDECYSDSDDNHVETSDVSAEMEKVKRLKKKISVNLLPPLPALDKVHTSDAQAGRIKALENAVHSLKQDLTLFRRELDAMKETRKPYLPATLAEKKRNVFETMGENEAGPAQIMHNGYDLLKVSSPPKDPAKCALKLLDRLFTPVEMAGHVLYKLPKSTRQPLDPERVSLMYEVLNIKYSHERLQKDAQNILDSCNQKLRDQEKKLKKEQSKAEATEHSQE